MYIGKTQSPITVILLSIVTCGIYMYYWLYTVMNDINNASGKPVIDNVTMYLVLSIFCAPFIFIVLYKVDKAFAELCPQEGVPYKENFLLWILLMLVGVGTWFAMFNITDTFNAIWAKRSGNTPDPNAQF